MFNVQGSEIIFLLLIALVVLGPEKLPEAVRKFTKTYAEFKKTVGGFQSEFRDAMDEPMRELRETANAVRDAAKFDIEGGTSSEMEKLTPPVSQVAPMTPTIAIPTSGPSTALYRYTSSYVRVSEMGTFASSALATPLSGSINCRGSPLDRISSSRL